MKAMRRSTMQIAGLDVLDEFSSDIGECIALAHKDAVFESNAQENTKHRSDIGRLMFFARFKLGLDYREDGSEVRILRAWCDYFKYHKVPFITVRTTSREVHILKERRAGEEGKKR